MSWNIFITFHILLACVTYKYYTSAAPTPGKKGRDNILLREAVKTLMGFKDLPKKDTGIISNPYDGKLVPKYMLDLFERYRDRNVPTGNVLANTVRSIYSEIGLVDVDSMFIFNLSSVESNEKILNGEIHVYKKKRRANSDITVTLYELAPYYMTELGRYRLNGDKFGWQVFSVTDAVKSCMSARRPTPHILALSFAKTIQSLKSPTTKPFPLKGYVRHLSRPFLVVYSNSDTNLTKDHLSPRFQASDLQNTFINPESGKRESFGKLPQQKNNSKKQSVINNPNKAKPTIQKKTPGYVQTVKKSQQSKLADEKRRAYKQEILRKLKQERKTNEARVKRSIYDNEIPEDPNEPLVPKSNKRLNKPPSGKGFQQKQKQHKSKSGDSGKKYRNTFKMSDFDIKDKSYTKSQYLPYPKDYDSSKKRRRKQNNSSQSGKNSSSSSSSNSNNSKDLQKGNIFDLPLPEDWGFDVNSDFISSYKQKSAFDNKLCKKRKSMLDFADIGWNDWVIAPKSFESNFCAGSCSFPKAQSINGLSNHATLQSLVHAVGINKNIPPPCCVPARMTSLSLLYFDQNKNVVLKNYPSMSVQTCECQ